MPPATQVHHGLTYPLHFAHRGGPFGPKSTTGMSSSRGSKSANGCTTTDRGIAQSLARRELDGTFQVVTRINRGEELPKTSPEADYVSPNDKEARGTHLDQQRQTRMSTEVHGRLEESCNSCPPMLDDLLQWPR